jgi:hypothetical protein
MGEMADLAREQMEMSASIIRNKKTGEERVVDNIDLMWSSYYSLNEWDIIKEVTED